MFDETQCLNTMKATALDLFNDAKPDMNIELAKNKLQLIQIQLNRLEQIQEFKKSYNQGAK